VYKPIIFILNIDDGDDKVNIDTNGRTSHFFRCENQEFCFALLSSWSQSIKQTSNCSSRGMAQAVKFLTCIQEVASSNLY
jgi:hypothetical protein